MEPKKLTRRVVDGVEVTEGSDNVFADLGLPDAESLLAKAELALQVAEAIRERKLTQQRAAELMGVSQPRVSDLLRGRLDKFSFDTLVEFLTRLRLDVTILISSADTDRGRLRVRAEGSDAAA
ncbi:MAG TPA: helix-turn-helix transcriptional regulator [Longimicrobium sp.]